MSLSSGITLSYKSNLSAVVEMASLTAAVQENRQFNFLNGVDENQCDLAWYDQGSLPAEGLVDIDLNNLFDSFGVAIAFAKLKALIVENTSDQTLKVGGAITNPFFACFGSNTDKTLIPAQSPLVIMSKKIGFTVDATHKILRVENSSLTTPATYNIWLIGTSV